MSKGASALLQQGTSPLRLHLHDGAQDCPDCLVKHCLQSLLSQGAALKILDGANFLGHGQGLRKKIQHFITTIPNFAKIKISFTRTLV
jgi:hypothetical protein